MLLTSPYLPMEAMQAKLEECDRMLAALKDVKHRHRVLSVQEALRRNMNLITGTAQSEVYSSLLLLMR